MNSIKRHFDGAKQKGLVQTNVSILTRLISTVRDHAYRNIWKKCCCLLDNAQKKIRKTSSGRPKNKENVSRTFR